MSALSAEVPRETIELLVREQNRKERLVLMQSLHVICMYFIIGCESKPISKQYIVPFVNVVIVAVFSNFVFCNFMFSIFIFQPTQSFLNTIGNNYLCKPALISTVGIHCS